MKVQQDGPKPTIMFKEHFSNGVDMVKDGNFADYVQVGDAMKAKGAIPEADIEGVKSREYVTWTY